MINRKVRHESAKGWRGQSGADSNMFFLTTDDHRLTQIFNELTAADAKRTQRSGLCEERNYPKIDFRKST